MNAQKNNRHTVTGNVEHFTISEVTRESPDFRRVLWTGTADLAGHSHAIGAGDQCAVPAGTRHNFRNTGDEPLVLYTVYSPPEHAADGIHATKEEADAAEEAGLDQPPSA